MRVLMIGWEFPPRMSGGLGTACVGLARALGEARVDLTLTLPFEGECELPDAVRLVSVPGVFRGAARRRLGMGESLEPEPTELITPYSGYKVSGADQAVHRYAEAVLQMAGEQSFDIIHAHDWLCAPAGLAVHAATGRPLIVHVHSLESDRSGEFADPMIRGIEQTAMSTADRVVAVSHVSRQKILSEYDATPEQVSVVHNGVTPVVPIDCSAPDRAAKAAPSVLFLGRVTWQKGPEIFIRAAARVLGVKPETRFILAGSGDQRDEMMKLTGELGLQDAIGFPGFISTEEVVKLMCGATLFVMPSRSEPFGIVALEAALCRLPVVLSDCCGVREVLPEAIICENDNVDAFADAIVALLDDSARRTQLANQNHRAAQRCTWAAAAASMTEVYRSVLGGRKKI